MTLKKIAIIPARSGSKGLANKNILMLLDKPLMVYTIEAALKSEVFERVIVSTDSFEYKSIAEQYGAEVILRSEELASDSASSYMVIEDVLNRTVSSACEYFVLLQPTSPFRTYQHIVDAVTKFESNSEMNFLISMVESNKSANLIKPISESGSLEHFDMDFSNYRRQDTKQYTPNGAIFIGNNVEYLRKKHFFGSDSLAYVMNKTDSVDIDDKLDFEFAIAIATQKAKKTILLQAIEERIESKKLAMATVKPITLIGHSIFDYWSIDKLSGESVSNFGIAGINTKEYIDLILDRELLSQVGNKVILLAGTNDIVIDNWKKEDTLSWIIQIVNKITLMNSKVKISLIEIPKVRGRIDRSNRVISELNEYLKDQLSSIVHWVELGEGFVDEFGNLNSEFTYDGLHFTEQAYQELEKQLEKKI